MSWLGRFTNLFRRDRLDRELEEELAAHIEEALEHGRSAEEARRAFGATLHHRETSRDIKLLPWLDALASDAVFGWRQLNKHRSTSTAAILSLALAIGATTAAFRLVDAVLLRPMPVSDPNHLYYIVSTFIDQEGHPDYRDDADYPMFREYRRALAGKGELILAGGANQQDVLIGTSDEIERPFAEFVSGNFFGALGIQPALGRLLTSNDDVKPGGHPIAVIGYDYWSGRFGRNPKVIGSTFRARGISFEIVGVAAKGFTGTQTGAFTDIYFPAAMNVAALNSPGWSWFRILVRPKSGVSVEQIRQPLQATLSTYLEGWASGLHPGTPKQLIANYLQQSVLVLPAASGASDLQKVYRQPLVILGILVALVLLVACANVGNLLSAQASARAREMALRVSIGAGRRRLIQMVLVESALLAAIASAAGALFSWWSAPFVVSMLAPPESPVRLALNADWRVIGFGVALTAAVALLFGLVPALRASSVQPLSALRGGQDAHTRRGLMNSLIAVQVAFCVLVLFVAGLFVTTFDRLSTRPLGFSHQHLLTVEAGRPDTKPSPAVWTQVMEHLRQLPGIQSVALSSWPPLSRNRWTTSVSIPGRAEEARMAYCMDLSPGYFDTMRMGMLDGRDFRPGDLQAKVRGEGQIVPGVAIVNQAFARAFFDGQNPVGRTFTTLQGKNLTAPVQIVGYVRDAVYDEIHEQPIHPTVYVPAEAKDGATLLVRTSGDLRTIGPVLRREIPLAAAGFRVRNIEAETSRVRRQMVRERLLATLSLFFAVVALILAGIGLYGVLNYSMLQQRREIGIRMALGARPAHVVRRVTAGMLAVVALGAAAGVAGGLACGRFVESLLFGVKVTDIGMIAIPVLTLMAAAIAASIPPAARAVRIDPAQVLRE